MSIKLLDTLEPAGQFNLADATNISYTSEAETVTVADKLKEFDDKLNAEPVLAYLGEVSQYCPVTKVDLGASIVLPFKLITPALGSCNYLVERKITNSNDAFVKVRDYSESAGPKSFTVGTANSISDFTYRVSAVDSWGRQAKCLKLGPDGSETKVDFLEFRFICGGVQFNSTFKENFKKNIFETGIQSIKYPFTMNYAVTKFRWLLYAVTNDVNAPINDPAAWSYTPAADVLQESTGGVATDSIALLTFDNNTFSNIGTYYLHVCGAVSDTAEYDFASLVKSSVITDTIDLLAPSSIGISVVKNITDADLDTDSFISFIFVPKTNATVAQGYNQITAECFIYKDGSEYDSYRLTCTHAEQALWNIGRLPSGVYSFRVTCSAPFVTNAASIEIANNIIIKQAEGEGATPVSDNLLFYFDADSKYFNNNCWSSLPTGNSETYSIQTYNLSNRLGIINTYINNNETSTFKFAGNAYGMLYRTQNGVSQLYNPWILLKDEDNTDGFTFEAYFRSKCVGELSAKVISARKDKIDEEYTEIMRPATPGFSIEFDKVSADTVATKSDTPLLEDAWQHVAIVVDKKIRNTLGTDTDLVEDFNPYPTLRIYVDGVLTKLIKLSLDSDGLVGVAELSELVPFIINGSSEGTIAEFTSGGTSLPSITYQGECEIRLMRCYKRCLKSSEIYNNYLNSLLANSRSEVLLRNNTQLTTIYFVKNKQPTSADEAYWEEKQLKNTDFKTLNSIKQKESTEKELGSKQALVNCTMHYHIDDKWGIEPNVDVYLQGTSSLEYPVKNYKIKVFEVVEKDGVERRKKKKILPPFKSDIDGWYTPDSVYTLKCDFMEQSHRNNTPTAGYFQDVVLDAVINTQVTNKDELEKCYSPARRVTKQVSYEEDGVAVTKTVRPYRDSIDGFACILYYNENNTGIDVNDLGVSEKYKQTSADIYTGSYMFNVDKEGAQLGFEVGESASDIKVFDSKIDSWRYPKNDAGDFVTNLALDCLPCISFEGATNNNASAAAFVPLEKRYLEEARIVFTSGLTLYDSDNNKTSGTVVMDSFEALQEALNNGEKIYYKNDAGAFVQLRSDEAVLANMSEEEKLNAKYDYFAATLEPRFTFADAYEDIDDTTYNELTYSVLDRAINWVYYNSDNREIFRSEFSNYFSFEYCLAYYLQMHVFAQTDNAGKNAMFDYWYGDGKLYPRPYDMDTQMGLDNSGSDKKPTSSELNPELSPSSISGSAVSAGILGSVNDAVPTWKETTAKSHARFGAYNTSESKLWKAFGMHFSTEISQAYAKLRDSGAYSVENICNYIDSKTSKVIGERFYNRDAVIKYLSYLTTNNSNETVYSEFYVDCLHGNRTNRYRQFLAQRLAFLDTVYAYERSVTNGSIELRANARTSSSSIGIHVYSPQYIRISVDAGKQADIIAYADPNDRYYLDGTQYSGTLFNIPTTGTDKNIIIYGAGNIRVINHTEALNLTKFNVEKAIKLTEINLNGANQLSSLTLGNNIYIRNLYLANTASLAVNLDLSKCENLKTVNVSRSAISGLTLAKGSNIEQLNLTNSNIIKLELEDLALLTTEQLKLDGCNKLNTIKLVGCSLLQNVSFAHLSELTSLTVANCPEIDTVDVSGLTKLSKLELSGDITDLDFTNSAGTAFSALNLSSLQKLNSLSMSGLSIDGTLTNTAKIFLPKDITLRKLDLLGAKVSVLTAEQTISNTYDFSYIDFEDGAEVTFANNDCMQYIKNLKFRGILSSGGSSGGIFANCSKLGSLIGCELASTSTSMDGLFYNCYNLLDIGDTTNWDLINVESAIHVFDKCSKIYYSSIKNILKKLVNVKNLTSFLAWAHRPTEQERLANPTEYPDAIDADLFEHNVSVENLYYFFFDTGFKAVEPGLLDNVAGTVKNLNCTFSQMSNLRYVPAGLLKRCSNATNLIGTFQNDSNLGVDVDVFESEFGISCIMTDTCDIMPEVNSVRHITSMFLNCAKLRIADDLEKFMAPLTNLETASNAFYNCKGLTKIPNGLFKNNKLLKSLDATFARTSISELPDNLFADSSYLVLPTHTNLERARGLFANCASLSGIVNKYFFAATPNLKNIGGNACGAEGAASIHGVYVSVPGMFANTQIRGFHEEFLAPLTQLEDASMLFFNSTKDAYGTLTNCGGTGGAGKVTKYLPDTLDSSKVSSFKIYKTSPGNNFDTVSYVNYDNAAGGFTASTSLPSILFEKNKVLKNIKGMFAGNIYLTGFPGNLFENQRNTLEDVSAMFIKCTSLEDNEGSLSALLQGISSLKNVSHMFADCTALHYDISSDKEETGLFYGCTSLQGCEGTFMNSAITGDVPAHLFNSCRSAITDVSYMFAGCEQLQSIKTGSALINDPEALLEGYHNELRSYFNAMLELPIEGRPDNFNYEDINFDKFIEDVEAGIYTADQVRSFEDYKTNSIKIDIKQKGLLSDCLSLKKVDHMFSGCENLSGPIPADMFYLSGQKQNSNITSLSGLFDCCFRLTLDSASAINTKQDFNSDYILYKREGASESEVIKRIGGGNYKYVYPTIKVLDDFDEPWIGNELETDNCRSIVPSDWISGFTGLTNISRMFYNVGAIRIPRSNTFPIVMSPGGDQQFTYSVLRLPDDLFEAQSRIEDASWAFAFMGSAGATDLSSRFLYRNLAAALKNIHGIFCCTELNSIDNIFSKNTKNIILQDVGLAFYATNRLNYDPSCYAADEVTNSNGLPGCASPCFFDPNKFSKVQQSKATGAFYLTNATPYYYYDDNSKIYKVNNTIATYFTDSVSTEALHEGNFSRPELSWLKLFSIDN